MDPSRVVRFKILSGLLLLLPLIVGGFAVHSLSSLHAVEDLYSVWREHVTQLADHPSEDQTTELTRPSSQTPGQSNGRMRLESLLHVAETHGVRVQFDVLSGAPGEARNRSEAKLTGSYTSIRTWLVDVCTLSPELLITTARFRRGTTDGDARAEIIVEELQQ